MYMQLERILLDSTSNMFNQILCHRGEEGEGGGRERERASLPAVDYHGSLLVGMILGYPLPEAKKGCGKLWHSMVGPNQEVELFDLSDRHLNTTLTSNLNKNTTIIFGKSCDKLSQSIYHWIEQQTIC